MPRILRKLDLFVVSILAVIGLAALFPARGGAAPVADHVATRAVSLLFFLYGVRLSPKAALNGFRHWRLHLTVFCSTYVVFPLLGLAAQGLRHNLLTPDLCDGLLFACLVSSTVQASIAFTSIAEGNVAAAICAASFSSLVGIVLTPLLAASLMPGGSAPKLSAGSALGILEQLVLPFALGQLARPWIGDWVGGHKLMTKLVDRGSILCIVYSAFSTGMDAGIWHRVSFGRLVMLLVVDLVLLGVVLTLTSSASRLMKFSREDRVTIVFCGSKKSLANGLPMASVLFAGRDVGLLVLPLMLFHLSQLIACSAIARRWARGARPLSSATENQPAGTAANT